MIYLHLKRIGITDCGLHWSTRQYQWKLNWTIWNGKSYLILRKNDLLNPYFILIIYYCIWNFKYRLLCFYSPHSTRNVKWKKKYRLNTNYHSTNVGQRWRISALKCRLASMLVVFVHRKGNFLRAIFWQTKADTAMS